MIGNARLFFFFFWKTFSSILLGARRKTFSIIGNNLRAPGRSCPHYVGIGVALSSDRKPIKIILNWRRQEIRNHKPLSKEKPQQWKQNQFARVEQTGWVSSIRWVTTNKYEIMHFMRNATACGKSPAMGVPFSAFALLSALVFGPVLCPGFSRIRTLG